MYQFLVLLWLRRSATFRMYDLDEQDRSMRKSPAWEQVGDFCTFCYFAGRDPRLMGRLIPAKIVHYAI